MSRSGELRHWDPRRFFGRQRFVCDCKPLTDPNDGTLLGHNSSCRTLWAKWARRERFRRWLLHLIPVGGVTTYEEDGTHQQRPMTSDQHIETIFDTEPDDNLTKFQRRQRRIQRHALSISMHPKAPTWGHLALRLWLLSWEGVVRLRRFLLWLAPFLATVYVVLDLLRG